MKSGEPARGPRARLNSRFWSLTTIVSIVVSRLNGEYRLPPASTYSKVGCG